MVIDEAEVMFAPRSGAPPIGGLMILATAATVCGAYVLAVTVAGLFAMAEGSTAGGVVLLLGVFGVSVVGAAVMFWRRAARSTNKARQLRAGVGFGHI